MSVAIQMPVAGIIPSDIKIAIYQRTHWDFDRRRSNFNPVRFTDRDGDGPGARGGAEWVPISEWSPPTRVSGTLTWTVVFGASTSVPDEVPNGMWVLACKYNTEVTAAILSFDPATGLARVEHRYHSSEITVREFEVSGSTEDFTPPDPYVYMPTTAPSATWPRNRTSNEVSEPLDLRWTYNDRQRHWPKVSPSPPCPVRGYERRNPLPRPLHPRRLLLGNRFGHHQQHHGHPHPFRTSPVGGWNRCRNRVGADSLGDAPVRCPSHQRERSAGRLVG